MSSRLIKRIKQAPTKRREGYVREPCAPLEMSVHLRYQSVTGSIGWPCSLGKAEMENWTAALGS